MNAALIIVIIMVANGYMVFVNQEMIGLVVDQVMDLVMETVNLIGITHAEVQVNAVQDIVIITRVNGYEVFAYHKTV
jgi:hypothetical protein